MSEVQKLEKPLLRGLGMRSYSRWLYGSLGISMLFALWFKVNVVEARKELYQKYWENLDDEKVYEGMKAAGIFKGFERP